MFGIRECAARSIGFTAILGLVTFASGCPHYNSGAPTALRPPQQKPAAVNQKSPTDKLRVEDFRGSLAWPVDGKVISEYGVRGGVQYNGIGIQAREGTPVKAAADGRVGSVKTIGEYGKVVLIEHADRLVTVYAHLKEIRVTNGEQVKRGQIIGTVGTSGRVETPSLHFEVRSRSKPRNPLFFLGGRA